MNCTAVRSTDGSRHETVPDYWAGAQQALAAGDPVMARLIAACHGECLVSRGDAFATLARSIVGQQISVKAADTVWQRLTAIVPQVDPEALLRQGETGLQGCGLSQRKHEYLLDLAAHFVSGRLDPARWPQLDDEAVIAELTGVRGIGRWTAEMFLIFCLLRPDVFPLDDIGLQRAMFAHYFAGEKQPRRVLQAFAVRWQPWRSVATWHLWRSLDPLPVQY